MTLKKYNLNQIKLMKKFGLVAAWATETHYDSTFAVEFARRFKKYLLA